MLYDAAALELFHEHSGHSVHKLGKLARFARSDTAHHVTNILRIELKENEEYIPRQPKKADQTNSGEKAYLTQQVPSKTTRLVV